MECEIAEIRAGDGTSSPAVLRVPEGDPPFAGVVAVHGGMGARSESELVGYATTKLPAYLFQHGYAVLTADYRHPSLGLGEVDDIAAAYEFLCAHEGVDERRVALGGCSHGGVITYLASARIRPACVFVEEGQTDFIGGWELLQEWLRRSPRPLSEYLEMDVELWQELAERLGGLPHEVPDAYRDASPLAKAAHIQSPILIMTGDQEYLYHSLEMRDALAAAGRPCAFKLYEYASHAFLFEWKSFHAATRRALDDLLEFLDRYLQAPSP